MIPIEQIPSVNASLNGTATLLLLAGWIAIRSGRPGLHKKLMLSAFGVSALFLACYLYYHFNISAVTKYQGQGASRVVYFVILFSHIPLAMLVVPFSVTALWFALRGRFDAHRKVVRRLWPVWMYVSVTGVLIYLMLYVW